MIFEGITSTDYSTEWLQPDTFIPWQEMLHFPIHAQAVLTPFREHALSYIHRTALGLSKGLLESSIVEAVSELDEEDSLHLHLALTIDLGWDELNQIHDQILSRVAEWSHDWPGEQQADYARWIFFSLTPSRL